MFNNKFGYCNYEILYYGRVENMIIKGNILNIDKNNYSYKLIDTHNLEFPVYFDGKNTHVLNFENKIIDNFKIRDNVTLRFDFYDENSYQIEDIVKRYL
jgi:hypothetical protein